MKIPNKLWNSLVIAITVVASWHLPGCNNAPKQEVATSIDQAMELDTNLLYDDIIYGVGFDDSASNAIEVHHPFEGRVLEMIGSIALVVPIDEPWYDTISVDLSPYGPNPERNVPDSLWHSVDPEARIPVTAYRVERHWDETGPTSGVTDWQYEIDWWRYYNGDYAYRNQANKIRSQMGVSPLPG